MSPTLNVEPQVAAAPPAAPPEDDKAVERQARRALNRQTSGVIASQLTAGKRLISPSITEAVSDLSQREMRRRSEQGRFPKPVKLGEGKNGRIAYVESEVLEWVEAQIAERDRQAAADESMPEPGPEIEQPNTSAAAVPTAIAEPSTAPQRQVTQARARRSTGGARRS
jgi:predicted DNA-binding transcriptional regulator AlpA